MSIYKSNYRKWLALSYLQVLLWLFTIPVFAQFKLTGTITDGSTKKPIVAVNILIKNAGKGAVSDETGSFSLSLPAGNYQVTFSSVGYQSQTRTVAVRQDTRLKITLVPDNKQMEEVTITGK